MGGSDTNATLPPHEVMQTGASKGTSLPKWKPLRAVIMAGDTPRGAFTMRPPSAPKVAFSATASTKDSGALVGKGGAKPIATRHSEKQLL